MLEAPGVPGLRGRWLSAHLFVNAGAGPSTLSQTDTVARTIVAPFAAHCRDRGWIDRYFFIRYRENGSHVRLRLEGDPEVLAGAVQPALAEHLRATSPGVEFSSGGFPPAGVGGAPVRCVHWQDYEPETDRYGGPDALPVAERLFGASSDVTLALLAGLTGQAHSARLGKALLLMVAGGHAFSEDRRKASTFLEGYHRGYLLMLMPDSARREDLNSRFREGIAMQRDVLVPYVRAAWERLAEAEPVSDAVDQLSRNMRVAMTELRALAAAGRLVDAAGRSVDLRGIVASQVHMTNNRLGVTIDEESYLAAACVAGLADALQ
jgi:thiopeptide-type bacteriocin biosynthesis protein